jgi:transcriptional regulator with XRE-family HTH domain
VVRPDWAQRVVSLRKELGLSQVQFAELLVVTQGAVSRWESGVKQPSAEHFLQMGNLADENECLWFWRRAGVDVKRIAAVAPRTSPGQTRTRSRLV